MVFLIKLIDMYIGNIICNFLSVFKRQKNAEIKKIDKVLVVQLWGIGETILTLPSIEALRKKFPKAEINVLTSPRNKDVFFDKKNIDDIAIIKLNSFSVLNFILKNRKKYDLVIDMEEYLNVSAIISFFAGRKVIGYSHGARAKLYTDKVKYNDKQHAAQTFLDLVRGFGFVFFFIKKKQFTFFLN